MAIPLAASKSCQPAKEDARHLAVFFLIVFFAFLRGVCFWAGGEFSILRSTSSGSFDSPMWADLLSLLLTIEKVGLWELWRQRQFFGPHDAKTISLRNSLQTAIIRIYRVGASGFRNSYNLSVVLNLRLCLIRWGSFVG